MNDMEVNWIRTGVRIEMPPTIRLLTPSPEMLKAHREAGYEVIYWVDYLTSPVRAA